MNCFPFFLLCGRYFSTQSSYPFPFFLFSSSFLYTLEDICSFFFRNGGSYAFSWFIGGSTSAMKLLWGFVEISMTHKKIIPSSWSNRTAGTNMRPFYWPDDAINSLSSSSSSLCGFHHLALPFSFCFFVFLLEITLSSISGFDYLPNNWVTFLLFIYAYIYTDFPWYFSL